MKKNTNAAMIMTGKWNLSTFMVLFSDSSLLVLPFSEHPFRAWQQ